MVIPRSGPFVDRVERILLNKLSLLLNFAQDGQTEDKEENIYQVSRTVPGIVVGFLCLKQTNKQTGKLNDLSKLVPAPSWWSQDLNTRLMFFLLYVRPVLL